MTDVADAVRMIAERMPTFDAIAVPLAEALDIVLREDVDAERDQPPFDRVTMDGIAIAYRDWQAGVRRFKVAGTQAAGAPASSLTTPGECIETMTGAMLPEGADTVIPVERISRDADEALVDGSAIVTDGQFIHRRGSDRKAGVRLLDAGTRIGPPEIAILASAGRAEVSAARLPSIAVISTGDELVDVDDPIEDHQIRSTNDRAIEASLVRHRLARVRRVRLPDRPEEMLEAIRELHDQSDTLILSGGVSMGQYDFVPSVLEELGVELVFHRIEQRPGRPMWFGVSRDQKPVFALPGNPVSTMVCLYRYVMPALAKAMGSHAGRVERVVLSTDVEFPADLTYFLPVMVESDEAGTNIAKPCQTNTSGDFVSLAGTDGFVELPRGRDVYAQGTVAQLFRW